MSISNYLAADYSQLAKQAVGLTTEPSLIADKSILLAERKESKLATLGKRGTGFTETSGLATGEEYKSALADALATPDEKSKVDPAMRTGALADHLKFSGFNPEQVDALAAANDVAGLRNMYYGNAPTTAVQNKKPSYNKAYSLADFEAAAEQLDNRGALGDTVATVKALGANIARGAINLGQSAGELITLPFQETYNAVTGEKADWNFYSDETAKKLSQNVDKAIGYNRALDDLATKRLEDSIRASGFDIMDPSTYGKLKDITNFGSMIVDAIPAAVGGLGDIIGGGGALRAGGAAAIAGLQKAIPSLGKKIDDFTTLNKTKAIDAVKELKSKAAAGAIDNVKYRDGMLAIEISYDLGKKIPDVIKGNSMSNAYFLTQMDENLEKFKENNNGVDADIEQMAVMAATTKFLAEVQASSTGKIFNIDQLNTAVKAAKESALKSVVEPLAGAGGKTVYEASVEALDAAGNSVVQKYGTEQYKGKSVDTLISENSAEIATAAVLGGVGGGVVSGTTAGVDIASKGIPYFNNSGTSTKSKTSSSSSVTGSTATPVDAGSREVTPAQEYFSTLAEVDKDFKSGLITRDNALDYIDRLESMQELRYGLKELPDGLVAVQDQRYYNIANHVNSFITDENATEEQLKLQKRLPTTLPDPKTLGENSKDTQGLQPLPDEQVAKSSKDVLGSEPLSTEQVTESPSDTVYSDKDRKADAERLLHFVIDAIEFSPEEADLIGSRYAKFAKANGVELERLNTIVKSYASVEDEASIGRRGWISYESKLDALMGASKPNVSAINRQYRQLNKWLATNNNSRLDLEEGIEAAKQYTADKNKRSFGLGGTKTEAFKTQYTKFGGKPFEINIQYNPASKKWEADTTQAEKLVALKTHNEEELTRVLTKYNTKANQLIGDIMNTGLLMIPEGGVGTPKDLGKARAMDKSHVKSALTRLKNVFNVDTGITKVILDTQKRGKEKAYSGKWDSKYEYYKYNRSLINTGNYSEGDVVLVNAVGSILHSKSKRNISSLYLSDSEAAKELQKALDVGATVLLDREYIASKTTWYKNKEGKPVVKERAHDLNEKGKQVSNYLESKGYIAVPGNPALFVHKDSNIDVINAAEEQIKETRKKRTELTKNKNNLVTLSMRSDWLRDRQLGLLMDLDALGEPSSYTEEQKEAAGEIREELGALDIVIEATDKSLAELSSKLESAFGKDTLETFEKDVGAQVEETAATEDESIVEGTFDGDVALKQENEEELDLALTQVAVDTKLVTPKDKMQSYVARRKAEIIEAAESVEDPEITVTLKDDGTVSWSSGSDKGIAGYYKKANEKVLQEIDENMKKVLGKWKQFVAEGLRGEELSAAIDEAINEILPSTLSTDAVNITKSLLELSMGKGKPVVYETVISVMGKDRDGKYTINKGERILTSFSQKQAEEKKAKYDAVSEGGFRGTINPKNNEERLTFITNRTVELDPNTYLEAGRNPTFLSKFSVGTVDKITAPTLALIKAAEKVLLPASKAELGSAEEYVEYTQSSDTGKFNLYNSPARGIMFNSQGKLSPQVMGAMHLALADMLVTDKSKLTKGYKDDEAIAAMFGFSTASAVTKKMRALAKEHGSLRRTVATSLGKSIASQLGIKPKKGNEAYVGMYEAMVADLGNTALVLAEEIGLIESTEVKSSEIGALRKGGDVNAGDYVGEEITRFVNITSNAEGKLSKKAKEYEEAYSEYKDDIPGISTLKVNAEFAPFTEGEVEAQISRVRNDATNNLTVAPQAAEALKGMITTRFEVNVEDVQELLSAYDKHEGIKRQLGWLPLEGQEFDSLSYAKKEVQEAINRGVEKSFETLRALIKAKQEGTPESELKESFDVWFRHFYATNGRYMIDSNQVNPQTDKLHRFLVQPASFKVTHEVTGKGGAREFKTTVDGKEYDTSLYVRFALAQAFGWDIDKKAPLETVQFGNALLSLDKKQVEAIKKAILEDDGKKGAAQAVITVNGVEKTLKADHLSHTLQALNFMIKSFEGNVTSSLTAEFDAITSGFGNKLQQMPILSNNNDIESSLRAFDKALMDEHLARTGVVSASMRSGDRSKFFASVDGTIVGGINDMLGNDSTFKDSYQNLAVTVGESLVTKKEQIKDSSFWKKSGKIISTGNTSSKKIALAIFDLLPTKLEADGKVSKALRTLFKNPFMVFNYAAGISTIRENLSEEVVTEFFEKIAAGDKATVKAFISLGATITDSNGKKVKATEAELIKFARNNPHNSRNLEIAGIVASEGLTTVVDKLFGEEVEKTFRTNFGMFIKIQEATNDAFRLGFFRFNVKFNEVYKAKAEKGYVTPAEYKEILAELWEEFPWISGPLSENADNKDVIAVYGKASVKDTLTAGRASPSVKRVKNGKTESVGVNTVMTKLVAAASAGAVIPFHFIDGAEMAMMYNAFTSTLKNEEKGILTIHDAKMGPIHHTGELGWMYNKSFHEVGRDYNLLEQLKVMAERWSLDDIPAGVEVGGLKASTGGVTNKVVPMEYKAAVNAVRSTITGLVEANNSVREQYQAYNKESGTAYAYQHMIGTPDQIYIPGQTSYNGNSVLNFFKKHYTNVKNVKHTVVKNTGLSIDEFTVKANNIIKAYDAMVKKHDLAKALTGYDIKDVIEGCR